MLMTHSGVTLLDDARMTDGVVLFAPCGGDRVYLVHKNGTVAHEWATGRGFTFWTYLLPNGNLFTNERMEERKGVALTGSGILREYDWAGNVVWEHFDPYQHHDARKMAHGGAIYAAYREMSATEQAQVSGGVAGSEAGGDMFGEVLREVDASGAVIWEWDFVNLGYDRFAMHHNANRWSAGHTNTVEPLDGDRVLVSCKTLNMVFIVDKASGDVVWHFQDEALGGQHDAQMLDTGNVLVFANGAYARDLHHSQVWEIDPRTDTVVWSYKQRDNPQGFFSPHIGGVQRLASGNTLVCEGAKGCVFEVTPEGDVVWQYICPFTAEVPDFGAINWLFRARQYAVDGPEVQGCV